MSNKERFHGLKTAFENSLNIFLLVFGADVDDVPQKFRDLLGQVSQESIQLWSDSNLCQIDGVAALIVDSLEQSPHSRDVLQILCTSCLNSVRSLLISANESFRAAHVPSFRDAALNRQPNLLHALLTKASSAEQLFEPVCELSLGTKWADLIVVRHNMHISTFNKFIPAGVCCPTKAFDKITSQSSSRSDNC